MGQHLACRVSIEFYVTGQPNGRRPSLQELLDTDFIRLFQPPRLAEEFQLLRIHFRGRLHFIIIIGVHPVMEWLHRQYLILFRRHFQLRRLRLAAQTDLIRTVAVTTVSVPKHRRFIRITIIKDSDLFRRDWPLLPQPQPPQPPPLEKLALIPLLLRKDQLLILFRDLFHPTDPIESIVRLTVNSIIFN